MTRARSLNRSARWAVPVGAVAAVGLVIGGSMAASAAGATPRLPARTVAQLLADVSHSQAVPSSLSGVIVEKAALGLPRLPGAADGSAASWLAGTHTVDFWYGGPGRVRFAVPSQLGETDLRLDGRQLWLWSSSADTATHVVLPQQAAPGSRLPASLPAPSLPQGGVPTPQQAARQILAAVGPTTTVSVQRNVMVAGRAAYQLAIAPKASGSLIGQIRIAVDAHGYLPLRLQVFARGAASPAYQVGYTSLSTAKPAASNFTFTPPPGAKVKTIRVPASLPGPGASFLPPAISRGVQLGPRHGQVHAIRPGGPKVVLPRQQQRILRRALAGHLPRGVHLPRGFHLPRHLPRGARLPRGLRPLPSFPANGRLGGHFPQGLPPAGAPRVIGKNWLSVIEFRPGATSATFSAAQSSILPLSGSAAPVKIAGTASPYSSRIIINPRSGHTVGAAAGQPEGTIAGAPAWLGTLMRAAQPVHGTWGSGRLLRTALVSVLMTSDGRVLIGAVTPSVLYADAAQRT